MMRIIVAGLVAVALHAPAICVADVLSLTVTEGDLRVHLGLDPFRLSSPFTANGVDFEGTVTIVSGPLVLQTIDVPNGFTSYSYGSGLLILQGSGFRDDGTFFSGQFVATTRPFQIDLREGADVLFGGALAEDFSIDLDSGVFDPALARLLQVKPNVNGGGIELGLEAIDGDPDTRDRIGWDHRGFAVLDIDTQPASVPEPMLLELSLTSAIGWMALKRRTRGQMKHTGRVM